MPIHLKQSTASQEVPLGHFVDDADGKTAETALSIANTDIKVWKAGATTLANKNSGGATHISGGIYYCVLDATDTDTVGPLALFVAVSGALAVRVECEVLSAAVYDWLFGAVAPLMPTTAGRTLDVSATGAAGVDWSNVEAPTTTLNLSGTTVKAVTDRVTANTDQWAGSAVATPTVAGVPEVDLTHVEGTANASATLHLKALEVVNSAGDAVLFRSTGNDGSGLLVMGDGTGPAMAVYGGAAGIGLEVKGPVDGMQVYSTGAGHGLLLQAAGASKHGLLATGGTSGTSDGAKFVAGSGGVDVRGNAFHEGTAQAGGASTLTLASGASAVDDFPGYVGHLLSLTGGTGAGQRALISSYVGSTKVATVDKAWSVTPDSSTTYIIA